MLVNYVRTAIALKLNELKVDKRAVTAIEYALIAALIAVVIIGAVSTLGKNISTTFNAVSSEL
jgi:pilus assembly protein Flp/PilA